MYEELVKRSKASCYNCKLWNGYKCRLKGECTAQTMLEAADVIEELSAKYSKALGDLVKQAHIVTNADRIRSMTDEELAELIGVNIDCSICKMEVFETITCPASLTEYGKDCKACWLGWLKQEVE